MWVAESTVVEVMVFRGGAMIRRRASLGSEASSPEKLRFEGLPGDLDEDSLRVELCVPAGAAETGLPHLHGLRVVPAEQRATDTTGDELEKARRELESACRVERQVEASLQALSGLRTDIKAGGPRKRSFSIDARLAVIELKSRRTEALKLELAAAQLAIERGRHRVELLEQGRFDGAESRRGQTSVEVDLAWPNEACVDAFAIELSYFTAMARWQPRYTLRLATDSDALEFEMRARVAQWTGEDWTQAQLKLSTAVYSAWVERPKLRSLRLGRAQPSPVVSSGWRKPTKRPGELYVDFDRAMVTFRDELRVRFERTSTYAAAAVAGPAPPSPEAAIEFGASEMMDDDLSSPSPTLAAGGFGGTFRGSESMAAAGRRRVPPAAARKRSKPRVVRQFAPNRALLDYSQLRIAGHGHARRGCLIRPGVRAEEAGAVRNLGHAGDDWPEVLADASGFDFVYVCDTPVDVASRRHGVVLSVVRRGGASRMGYVSVPSRSAQVFRSIELRNPLEGPLLAAPVDVHLDGQYYLSAEMPQTPVGGGVKLGLGVESALKIRRSLKYHEDTSGLLQRHNDIGVQLTIEVRSNLGRSASLEIREALPVPAKAHSDDVDIELGEVNPPWRDYEPAEGQLNGGKSWLLELAPGSEQVLTAQWRIRIPKKFEIAGGYRG